MNDELRHECGLAAVYWLGKSVGRSGPAAQAISKGDVTACLPAMLLDLQNRGQLAAGITSYNPRRAQLLGTYKDIGTVAEAFRMSHPAKHSAIMAGCAGPAAIGHTRYATCGLDDSRYAQPFERHHGRLWKWFAFAFNGNLANFAALRDRLLSKRDYHFTLNTDTEMVMHAMAYHLRGDKPANLRGLMASLARSFDGAFNIAFLDAMGRMFVARDPLGIRPMCWAAQGRLFAAASESVALSNLGFDDVRSLEPGRMAIVENGRLRFERFAPARRRAMCFFEWVYFANAASVLDDRSVYLARARAGRHLAARETEKMDETCIVVPVPDTAKAAADAFAYQLGTPSVEGLIRNRYVGRTFIQSDTTRGRSVRSKYTALPGVLKGKRVFLIEDSIVRATTLRALVGLMRGAGRASQVHVRVACPPIVSPCFYGIDMSRQGELFAPAFVKPRYRGCPDEAMLRPMAKELGIDSLRYLSVDDLCACLQADRDSLCLGCVTGKYPSEWGNRLARAAKRKTTAARKTRAYE